MSSPGLAPEPPDAPGAVELRKYQALGFSQQQLDDYKAQESLKYARTGFNRAQIDSYWGDHQSAPQLTKLMAQNADSPHEAANPYESLLAGWQHSVSGIVATSGKPTLAYPSKNGLLDNVAASAGQFVGDLPAAIPGAFLGRAAGMGLGAAAGAAVPGAGETGGSEALGAAIGGTLGAGFGFNAVPQGIREALLAAYNHGQIHNKDDAWKVASQAALNTVKEGTVGALTNIVGGPAAKVAAKAGLGKIAQTGVRLGTEAATATTTGAVLSGHLPDAHDFAAAALLMVGLHGVVSSAGKVANGKYRASQAESRINSNLQNIYRETGIPPWQAAKMASGDPVFQQELMGQDTSGNPSTRKFKSQSGIEPAPYPKAPKATEGEAPKPATVEELMPLVRGLERSADNATSPAGAMGRYQIMPGTARQYGFDPSHLMDPTYNETVARHVLADLNHRYNGDTAAVLVAYNAGPGRAAKFLAAGRDPSVLPLETQKYLEHAEHLGLTMNGPYRPNWQAFRDTPGRVLRFREDGGASADPSAISSYLQEFGRLAGFRFAVSPEAEAAGGENRPFFGKDGFAGRVVYMPDTPDAVNRAWYGLGRYEILYHEVGHALDDHLDAATTLRSAMRENPGLKDELETSSRKWKPFVWENSPAHAAKWEEVVADGIARWLSDPTAKSEMPLFTKIMGAQLKPFADIAAKSLPVKGDGGEWTDPKGNAGGGGWYSAGNGGGGGQPPSGGAPATGGAQPPRLPSNRIVLNFDTRAERFQSDMVGEEAQGKYGLGDAVRQYVSELRPAELIDNILREDGRLGPKDLGVADMFRQTYGSEGRAISMLRDGPLSLKDPLAMTRKEGVKSYMAVLKDVQDGGGTLEGFDYWRSAKRTVQLDKRGIKGVMPIEEAQKTLIDAPKIYQQADKDLQAFQKSILEYGRDSGVFSQKQIDAMAKAGPSYISFRRIMGDDKSYTGTKTGGRSFRVGRSVFKIEGSDRQIISPLLTDIDNVRLITRMADRNRAVRSAIGTLSKSVGGVPALIKRERTIEIADPGSDIFKPYNLDGEETKAFIPMTAVKAESGGKNAFTLYEDGKPVLYKAQSAELAALMRGADSASEANLIERVFTNFAKLLRLGVVSLPDFVLRIGLRHEMTAYTYDPLHPPPLINGVSGAMDIFGKGKEFKEWAANGGAGSTFAEMGETTLKDAVFKMFNDSEFTTKAWNVFGSPMQMATALGEVMQSMNRVGYYTRAKTMGYEPLKAATMSRTAYLDYAQRGTVAWTNMWAKITPFLRAHILGTEMIAKAYANDPVGTVGRLVLSHSIPAIALYVLNYFQDESGQIPEAQAYKNIPRWEKDTYFITPQINGTRLRVPYGFQSGALWGGMVNRFLDSEYQKDPHAFDGWARSFANEFIPPVIPDLVHPNFEIAANENFYSGKPLIPDSVKDRSGPYQFTDATSEPAKALSKFISPVVNVSPIHIDEMVRGWAGTLGQDALKAGDAVMGHPGMPWEVSDIPFVQSFVVRNRGTAPQVIEDFYTDLDKVKEKNADFKFAEKTGDATLMLQKADGRAYFKLDQISKAIGVQRQLMRGIEQNAKMNNDEKRQNIDSLYAMMIAEAKDGSRTIKDVGLAK